MPPFTATRYDLASTTFRRKGDQGLEDHTLVRVLPRVTSRTRYVQRKTNNKKCLIEVESKIVLDIIKSSSFTYVLVLTKLYFSTKMYFEVLLTTHCARPLRIGPLGLTDMMVHIRQWVSTS
uniref:Uncharacterized protein n=1 Tax=Hyaloperonospora arabidopsidis (strain Emoy2) TaxID=559515 RepID=M4BJV8_HYAAE